MTNAKTGQRTLRVLIAEDEAIIRLDIRAMIEELGYQVVGEAKDGIEAQEMARQLKPDLILMDIKMPKVDGLNAVRQINADQRIPVILLTAFSQPELIDEAVELGVFAYLIKPINKADLLPTIEIAIARAREVEEMQKEVGSLRATLETRKRVERAKGLLMDTYNIAESEAFRRIQKLSMDSRKSMREIADAIILAKEIEK